MAEPVKLGPFPGWVMLMLCPSTVRWAVRGATVLFSVNVKHTMPSAMPVMVSQGWSLVGANGGSRFSAIGSTAGNTSPPTATGSVLGVGSTKARGSSLIALLPVSEI